jgi:curved DNA-binding protein CbpA
MSEAFVDYYELLGVPTNADVSQIRAAFLRLAKEHHPDVGGSTDDMQQFTRAYRTLMSESARKLYDHQHEFHSDKPGTYAHSKPDTSTTEVDDLTDDEVDEFLDTVFREYQNKSKEKKSFWAKLKEMP